MPTLPLIDWSPALIDRRLQFLESAARFVPPTAGDDTPAFSKPERELDQNRPIIDVHALMMAADLAFATNRTQRGLDILKNAVGALCTRGDLPAAALPGSVAARIVTVVRQGAEFEIVDKDGERRVVAQVPATSPISIALHTDLLIASLLSDLPVDRVFAFSSQWPIPVLGFGEPLLHALAAFVEDRDVWPAAREGLVANTVAWIERLGRLRRDDEHWKSARVRGALIDMRRLVIEIALLWRPDGVTFREWRGTPLSDSLSTGIERFVRDLAKEIAEAGIRLR